LSWGGFGLLGMVCFAWWSQRRKAPSEAQMRAYLDQSNACGGLLVAESERDIGDWSTRLPRLKHPHLHWRGLPSGLGFFVSLCFVLGCFWFPLPKPFWKGRAMNISSQAGQLRQQIQVLKAHAVITPKQAGEKQRQLKRLQSEARAEDPVKTWEALDHLRKKHRALAARADEQNQMQQALWQKLKQHAQKAERMADRDSSSSKANKTQKALQAERKRLAQKLQKLLQQTQRRTQSLSAAHKLLRQRTLSVKQLKQLLTLSQSAKARANKVRKAMIKAGLLKKMRWTPTPGPPKMCGGVGKGGAGGACRGKSGGGKGKERGSGKGRGKGAGISRGRGDAAMLWKYESMHHGAKFKLRQLTPQALDLQNQKQLGISRTAPSKSSSTSPT
ncbi:MAG: hypothetical protein AAGJ35_13785, partial [Myxococcota bacterium]